MSAWGQWAEEAATREDERWAYLYGLAHRRAEIFLELLGDKVQRCQTQAEVIRALEGKVGDLRRENAELSEALEEAEQAREEAEARDWVR